MRNWLTRPRYSYIECVFIFNIWPQLVAGRYLTAFVIVMMGISLNRILTPKPQPVE